MKIFYNLCHSKPLIIRQKVQFIIFDVVIIELPDCFMKACRNDISNTLLQEGVKGHSG